MFQCSIAVLARVRRCCCCCCYCCCCGSSCGCWWCSVGLPGCCHRLLARLQRRLRCGRDRSRNTSHVSSSSSSSLVT
ncbi:hypothetical protein BZA05DRAFT_401514 [Tricharina praecox]|uniref:uncharacterized protein n=1 Tax=Tricharina praecox TaxID=43433 RepID=UPI00221E40C6|nr:uncharacterized protein BZA05DRAFT_401514 [Tricharina praecox]KAI5849775.1 hypothetical protein BZA05DRAFT_401514 [Tricharina praecox]